MKTKILLLLFLVLARITFGQSGNKEIDGKVILKGKTIAEIYLTHIDNTLKKYKDSNWVIHPRAQAKNLNTIYQSIIPNNQSLNDNTSSFSYIQNDDNQKISISSAYQFSKMSKNFLNVGISTEGKEGIFNIYSSKSWSNNVALSLGFSKVFMSSQFYLSKDIMKMRLIEKRKLFADSLKGKILYSAKLNQSTLNDYENNCQHELDLLLDELKEKDYVEEDIEKKINDLNKSIKDNQKKKAEFNILNQKAVDEQVNEDVIEKLSDFDLKNDILYGYQIFWWQISSKFLNNTYTFKEINDADKITNINVFHANVNASLMWNRLDNNAAQYATVGISAFRGSFLSDPSLRGIKPLINGNEIVNDNITIGNIDNLKKALWQYSYSFYYANFFAFNKHLGISINGVYNNSFKNDLAQNYKENYTISLGPIFKINGEDNWNKATFGISAGYDNLPSKAKAKDYFAIKAYVGVPFNVFQKKNKD
ncbi:hypothetical protein [Chryseobacterium taichungense]|uniref:hypothetical protein n=1 Tax=Chryseobacterium taichungense TaxID=295069 RepID=UPI0028A70195|nr:hypothetical protein [Chryseobacterium taichungense]